MMVEIKFAALKGVKPNEYAVRFVFGGLCTVAAGLIAKRWIQQEDRGKSEKKASDPGSKFD